MSSITTAVTHRFIAAVIKGARALLRTAENLQARGEGLEAWANKEAIRRGCTEALDAITAADLSR
jgi:hypothetical protein